MSIHLIHSPNRVFCITWPEASYAARAFSSAPELLGSKTSSLAEWAVRTLFAQAGLDKPHFGSPEWNPLSDLISRDDRVLIKPNWVSHWNYSGEGLDCLVTHTSVIAAILVYVAKARPRRIIIGDAPIQGCNFEALSEACRFDTLAERFGADGIDLSIKDFRRTILEGRTLGCASRMSDRRPEDYIQFDLGMDSNLEPISDDGGKFRVTMYNPELLQQTHGPGRHQYLVAREAIEADVVINVPKLKTHKKACITGALKNVVGINGLKDYLPHHRKGGSSEGGDCYEGRSWLKAYTEDMLDAANRPDKPALRCIFAKGAQIGQLLGRVLGMDENFEGSWYGNDTVWRTCLDLQRILYYGRSDGGLGDRMQRRVITITDAIVAGEGEGPLAPTPMPLGLMTMGMSTCALDWTHALLMGFDPCRIPLTREAFSQHRYPLVGFGPDEIEIKVHGRCVTPEELVARFGRPFRAPSGWRGHCESAGAGVMT